MHAGQPRLLHVTKSGLVHYSLGKVSSYLAVEIALAAACSTDRTCFPGCGETRAG